MQSFIVYLRGQVLHKHIRPVLVQPPVNVQGWGHALTREEIEREGMIACLQWTQDEGATQQTIHNTQTFFFF